MKNHGIREVLIYQSIFLRWVGYEPEIRDENSSYAVMVPLSVAMRTTSSWSVPKFFQAAYDNDHPVRKYSAGPVNFVKKHVIGVNPKSESATRTSTRTDIL